jgi:4-amino-4-deoxy-L-arabinose transferase-like glycosyltransferase
MISSISRLEDKHKIVFAIMIGFAVVCFWRGAWGMMDLHLFPNNPNISYLIAFFTGFGILINTRYIVYVMLPRNR